MTVEAEPLWTRTTDLTAGVAGWDLVPCSGTLQQQEDLKGEEEEKNGEFSIKDLQTWPQCRSCFFCPFFVCGKGSFRVSSCGL